MIKSFSDTGSGGNFTISGCGETGRQLAVSDDYMKILWNNSEHTLKISVDGIPVSLAPESVLCATYSQRLRCENLPRKDEIWLLAFNQAFYCIHTNDSEVSCSGLLFFGSNQTPVIRLPEPLHEVIGRAIDMLKAEFDQQDQNQEEMLRLLLKQIIIRCTRLARTQLLGEDAASHHPENINLVRRFNVLVEEHFRTKKQVSDYAGMMYKSSKTISNVFSKVSDKSPLQIIHERIALEARRLLLYTDKTSREIGFELGFDDPAQFSRFFKKMTSETTGSFKEKHQNITITG